MGVDYSANFGFGIQVKVKENEDDENYCFIEWLDETLQGSKYEYFTVGEGLYTGDEDDVFITVDKEFLNLYNIKQESEDLINFLDAKRIEYIGTPDIVGGLLVW